MSILLAGVVLLNVTRAVEQGALRVLHAYHPLRPAPGARAGGDRQAVPLEIRLHHLRGVQLWYKGARVCYNS